VTLWGSRVTFEVSSAAPEADPVWVNLTAYALKIEPITVRIGRQNDLDQSEPATLSVLLNNNDDRFTYGNTSSPYTSWWGPGRKCRLRETIGTTVLDIFVGYLQVPTETFVTPSKDQTVSVQAVDRLGRLAASEPFPSALTAHIQDADGDELQIYLPGQDVQAPLTDPGQSFTLPEFSTFLFGNNAPPTDPLVAYAAAEGPPGDELSAFVYTPALTSGSDLGRFAYHEANLPQTITVDAGKSVAIAFWVNFQSVPSTTYNAVLFRLNGNVGAYMELGVTGSTAQWRFTVEDASGITGPTAGGGVCLDVWHLVALRLSESSGLVEFWHHGSDPITATIAGATQGVFTSATLSGQSNVAIAQVQVYYGAGAYSRTKHLAQLAAGYDPLARQTTGERIRTMARYAGIPIAEYTSTVDPGTTVMQAASLAGKTALDGMREAERTEQGLLYVDGSGRLVFKDRRSLYNI